jgi:hypothetical protein
MERRRTVVTVISVTFVLLSLTVMSLAGFIYWRRRKHRFSAQFIEVKPVIYPPNSSSQSDGEWIAFHSEVPSNIYGTVISSPAITTDTPGETISFPIQPFLFPTFPPPQTIKSSHSATLTYQPKSGIQRSASQANVAGFNTFPVSPLRLRDERTPSDVQSLSLVADTNRRQDRQNCKVYPSRNPSTDGEMYNGINSVNVRPSSLPPPPYVYNDMLM